MHAVPFYAPSVVSLIDGWHEVTELDVERDVVRLRRRENDDGPALDDADDDDRLPLQIGRWHQWLAS